MAAPAPALIPADPQDPNHQRSFGSLPFGVQSSLIQDFMELWRYRAPANTTLATPRQYGNGTWEAAPKRGDFTPLGGRSGGGIVHLWVCLDHNQKIVDRVVVKNAIPGFYVFDNTSYWNNHLIGTEPLESTLANRVHAVLAATKPGDEKYVTECLGWGGMVGLAQHAVHQFQLPQYKLYYEYCLGSLGDLIRANQERIRWVRRPGAAKRRRIVEGPEPLDEGFLWMLFEALTKTAVAMDTANIYHGDMQIANVLLGSPDPNEFPLWPVPKVADFGSARVLRPLVKRRWGNILAGCALPWAAPEMSFNPGAGSPWTVPNMQLSSKTNIYQIGMLMCCAMRLEPALEEACWRRPPLGYNVPVNEQLGFIAPRSQNVRKIRHANARYSRVLLRLVKRCLRFNPTQRPTPAVLLQDVQNHMPPDVVAMRHYRTATGRMAWNHPKAVWMNLTDKYKVGRKKPRRA